MRLLGEVVARKNVRSVGLSKRAFVGMLLLIIAGCGDSEGPNRPLSKDDEHGDGAEDVLPDAATSDGETQPDAPPSPDSPAESGDGAVDAGADTLSDASPDDAADAPHPVSQFCGDRIRNPVTEECDDGTSPGSCTADCRVRSGRLLQAGRDDGGDPRGPRRRLGSGRHITSAGSSDQRVLAVAKVWEDLQGRSNADRRIDLVPSVRFRFDVTDPPRLEDDIHGDRCRPQIVHVREDHVELALMNGGGAIRIPYTLILDAWTTIDQRMAVRLFLNEDFATLDQRIDVVQTAVRALNQDQTFNDAIETGTSYRAAAEKLSERSDESAGYRFVIFGHTHHAKDVKLDSGARYPTRARGPT
jgi:hypothetical protein